MAVTAVETTGKSGENCLVSADVCLEGFVQAEHVRTLTMGQDDILFDDAMAHEGVMTIVRHAGITAKTNRAKERLIFAAVCMSNLLRTALIPSSYFPLLRYVTAHMADGVIL